MRAKASALCAVSLAFALAASCRQRPPDEPEVPCCVNGFMASCHGRDQNDQGFSMCGGGRCVVGNATCPQDVAPAPDAEAEPAAPVADAESDAVVDAAKPAATSSEECLRELEPLERRFVHAGRCVRDDDCTTAAYACLGSCGRGISKRGLEGMKSALDDFQARCASSCPVPKCAPWVVNTPVCRARQCVIPRDR
jgi:hypothetical protein